MAGGSWSLDLIPETPRWVREEFKDGARGEERRWRSWVVFVESDFDGVDGRELPQTVIDDLAEQALWVGPVWERGNKLRSFGGPGLAGTMGNDRGSYMNPSVNPAEDSGFPLNFTQVVQDWFPTSSGGTNGIRYGGAASANLGTINERLPGSYLPPLKEPLDELAAQTNNEWYIRPANRINWGDAESLFEYPPKVLIAEGLATNVPGYTTLDVPIDGIQSTSDIYGLLNAAKVISDDFDLETGSGSAFINDSSGLVDARSWPEGGILRFGGGITRAATNSSTDATQLAAILSEHYDYVNRTITITANDPCVLGSIRPGDWVAIYSPDDDIVDTSHQITAAGQPIHPEWLRSVAVHQPFNRGMGAFVVQYFGTSNPWNVTRITDYIADESGPCTIEVGQRPRPAVPSRFANFIDG